MKDLDASVLDATGICPKCGLTKNICACETRAKEQQNLRVRVETRRYRKRVTIISGFDTKSFDVKSLFKKLKQRLACGGKLYLEAGEIELQGSHLEATKELLKKEGFVLEEFVMERRHVQKTNNRS